MPAQLFEDRALSLLDAGVCYHEQCPHWCLPPPPPLPPHYSPFLALTDLSPATLAKCNSPFSEGTVHQKCSFFFVSNVGRDDAGRTQREGRPASCSVLTTSRRIGLLPQFTGVPGRFMLIRVSQSVVSSHLESGRAAEAPKGLQGAAAAGPFIRGQMKLHRAVIHRRRGGFAAQLPQP